MSSYKNMKKILPLIIIILVVLSLWLGCLWLVTYLIDDWATRGQFGDLFGSINALFSGLAFAGLIYTIFLQKKELELQREELKLQREEMVKYRKELAEQAKVQKLQFLSSIAKLKAEASRARIEALKMESEQKIPSGRTEYQNAIKGEAEKIELLVKELEENS